MKKMKTSTGVTEMTEVVTPERVADLLERTVEELELHGHVRHTLTSRSGPAEPKCVIGAMRYVSCGNVFTRAFAPLHHAACVALLDELDLGPHRDVPVERVIMHNDDPSTDLGSLRDHLRFAAKRLRGGAS